MMIAKAEIIVLSERGFHVSLRCRTGAMSRVSSRKLRGDGYAYHCHACMALTTGFMFADAAAISCGAVLVVEMRLRGGEVYGAEW